MTLPAFNRRLRQPPRPRRSPPANSQPPHPTMLSPQRPRLNPRPAARPLPISYRLVARLHLDSNPQRRKTHNRKIEWVPLTQASVRNSERAPSRNLPCEPDRGACRSNGSPGWDVRSVHKTIDSLFFVHCNFPRLRFRPCTGCAFGHRAQLLSDRRRARLHGPARLCG